MDDLKNEYKEFANVLKQRSENKRKRETEDKEANKIRRLTKILNKIKEVDAIGGKEKSLVVPQGDLDDEDLEFLEEHNIYSEYEVESTPVIVLEWS